MTSTARSNSPLFDSLVAELQPGTPRPLTPIRAAREVAPATAPTWMQSRPVAATAPSGVLSEPISVVQLTAEEREIVSEMGSTVSRLLLQMMRDESSISAHR